MRSVLASQPLLENCWCRWALTVWQGAALKSHPNSRDDGILLITRAVKIFLQSQKKQVTVSRNWKAAAHPAPGVPWRLDHSCHPFLQSINLLIYFAIWDSRHVYLWGDLHWNQSPLSSRRKNQELEWCTLFFVRKEPSFFACRQIFAFAESSGVSVPLFASTQQARSLAF